MYFKCCSWQRTKSVYVCVFLSWRDKLISVCVCGSVKLHIQLFCTCICKIRIVFTLCVSCIVCTEHKVLVCQHVCVCVNNCNHNRKDMVFARVHSKVSRLGLCLNRDDEPRISQQIAQNKLQTKLIIYYI